MERLHGIPAESPLRKHSAEPVGAAPLAVVRFVDPQVVMAAELARSAAPGSDSLHGGAPVHGSNRSRAISRSSSRRGGSAIAPQIPRRDIVVVMRLAHEASTVVRIGSAAGTGIPTSGSGIVSPGIRGTGRLLASGVSLEGLALCAASLGLTGHVRGCEGVLDLPAHL